MNKNSEARKNTIEFSSLVNEGSNIISTDISPKKALVVDEIVKEDPSSLWQYCIHEEGQVRSLDLILAFLLLFFYFVCFYSVVAQLSDTPTVSLSTTKKISNAGFIWLAKYFFLCYLFVQAENECYDGWRMIKYAQGTRNTILFGGICQYTFGCLVEIISYCLINRSSTIFNIMGNSASLTVYLRIDDVIVSYINKLFPQRKRKVSYNKTTMDKDDRPFLYGATGIKIAFFIILEILFNLYNVDLFI